MDPGLRVEMIRARAYELWELRGRPEGREWEHWLEAERELRAAESDEAARLSAASPPGNGHHAANGSGVALGGLLAWAPDWLREKIAELETAAQKLARGRGGR